jgi:arylsulfatase A-like enzyme
MPQDPWDIWRPEGLDPHEVGATSKPSRIPAELSDTVWFTDRGLDHLRGTQHKSWFLHLGYYRPHPPFAAPAPYHEMYDPAQCPSPIRAASAEAEAAQHPMLRHYVENIQRKNFFQNGQGLGSDMSEAEVRQMRATYYGLITEIDTQLGRVFKFLKDTGQWDNTLIILTSDHGEQLGDHHLLGKIGYFDQSYHIPMIVRDPDASANGTRGSIVDKFTETIDTMPTVLDWMGQPSPRACDGHSLLPFLREGKAPEGWRTEVHYEYDYRNIFYSKPQDALGLKMDQCSLAVTQDERFKYVHFPALQPLFFDLQQDPQQLRNVAGDPAYAPQMLRYAQKMLDWRLLHADRTLTGFAASPEGLMSRL